MEKTARDVLNAKLATIKETNVNPEWLAGELLSAQIIGPGDAKKAGLDDGKIDDAKRGALVYAVMGCGKPGAFEEFVDLFLNQEYLKWLGNELKGAYIKNGGEWKPPSPPVPDPHPVTPRPGGVIHADSGGGGAAAGASSKYYRVDSGLVLIVSCNYKDKGTNIRELHGTDKDGKEMFETFNNVLRFDTRLIQNDQATKAKIMEYLQERPRDDHKVIIFAFSGHGLKIEPNTETGSVVVCQDNEFLPIEEIKTQLTTIRPKTNIPIILFIDACRGNLELWSAQRSLSRAKGNIEEETNICTYFATIDEHVSYENEIEGQGKECEGRWMPKVARHIREDNTSLGDIMATVHKEVYPPPQQGDRPQQGHIDYTLNCGPLYFHPKK